MVASKEPLRIDFLRLTQKMKRPATQRDLTEVHLDNPYTFLSYFVANDNALVRFVQGSNLLNTDDLPLIEYKLPFLPDSPPRLENLLALKRIKSSILPLLVNMDSNQKARLLAYEQKTKPMLNSIIAEAYNNWGSVLFLKGKFTEAIAHYTEALRLKPDLEQARLNLNRARQQKKLRRPQR